MYQKVVSTAKQHGDEHQVCLLAVSKTKPADMIEQLYSAGHKDFGENYLQEALQKQEQLAHCHICWHFIGNIQRNKTKDIANHFSWVHTVDRDIIAERLSNQRDASLPALNVCIQVNIDDEDSKSGCSIGEVMPLVTKTQKYDNIQVRGLMVIPSKDNTDAFERTRQLFDNIKQQINPPHWDTLSMGMSNDFEQAIGQGATIIRVGSAIFGERN